MGLYPAVEDVCAKSEHMACAFNASRRDTDAPQVVDGVIILRQTNQLHEFMKCNVKSLMMSRGQPFDLKGKYLLRMTNIRTPGHKMDEK